MGNCHCRPREGGESLRGFLTRNFHKIARKRKIDDLVTIAIQDEGENLGIRRGPEGTSKAGGVDGHLVNLELEDLEYETVSEDDYRPDSDGRISLNQKPLEKCEMYENFSNRTEEDCQEKPPKHDVFEHKEENDYIRILQQQLQQVQSELANLQRNASSRGQFAATGINQDDSYSARSFQSQQSDETKAGPGEPRYEIDSPVDAVSNRTHRGTFLHAQGDSRGYPGTRFKDTHNENIQAAGENKVACTRMVQMRGDVKGDIGSKSDKIPQKDGRRSKVQGMITEGLRTRADVKLPRVKAQVSGKETLQNNKTTKKKNTVEDKARIAAKIATLQKRDPTLPGPDKGIVWPKTMASLSKADKAYYVEQFLRSELFRQRCLRKYQGSKTWMNGLTPFHLWVLENEDTTEIEAVLNPLPKRQNNAQAKVRCWRGNTPPPPPKSQ